MSATIVYNTDQKELFETAVNLFFSEAIRRAGRPIPVALPGGRSIVGFLQRLRERATECPANVWRSLHFFMVDERLVPIDHEQSNYKLVYEQVLSTLVQERLIGSEQLHPFRLVADAPDHGVEAYVDELKKFGGRFEIAFVGVGEDAHIGALFPNHHSIEDAAPFFITMGDSPKPPPQRMSASATLISQSTAVFAIFTGEAKRDALVQYLDQTLPLNSCPAKLVDRVRSGFVLTDLPLRV